jgi:hypothetical protein
MPRTIPASLLGARRRDRPDEVKCLQVRIGGGVTDLEVAIRLRDYALGVMTRNLVSDENATVMGEGLQTVPEGDGPRGGV